MSPADPSRWLSIFERYPVLQVMLFGLICSWCAVQFAKSLTDPNDIGFMRFRRGARILALLAGFGFTRIFWYYRIPGDPHGLENLVSVAVGLASPPFYSISKRLVAWKFPALAERMSSDYKRMTITTDTATYRRIEPDDVPPE